MSEKEKYLNLYSTSQGETAQTDIIPGQMGGGYGRICWGENMLEPLKEWNIASLLDVGCGYGNFCDAAALFIPRVYGLDIASVATGNVINNPEITYLDGEAKALPLPDNAVEWITSFDCLEHCLESDIDVILNEFKRVASTGFILSISYEPCEADGMPLHMTVKPESWWIEKLSRYGEVSKEGRTPITGAPYLICRKPVEKTIVCYCAGSIGTRLRSMDWADRLARKTGRRLTLVWLQDDPLCLSSFTELFNNPIPQISEKEMLDLSTCKIYAQIKDVADQALISGGKALRTALQKWGASELDAISIEDQEDHIIVYAPGVQIDTSADHGDHLLESLTPTLPIQDRIRELTTELGINRAIMGVHARGTDFGIPKDAYVGQIRKALHLKPDQRFIACSDEPSYEEALKTDFPGQMIIRHKSAWMRKKDTNLPWALGNITTSEASVQEAIIDLYLLANSRFEIYHESSAFAQSAALLSRRADMETKASVVPPVKNRAANSHSKPSRCGLLGNQHPSPANTYPASATIPESNPSPNGTSIYYVCPDIDMKSAGIRRLYRHVGILTAAGFKAYLLHQNHGFRRSDLPDVPIRYMSNIDFNPNDIVVIPEGCPTIMKALKDHPVRRFAIALNWDYVYKVLGPGMDWRAFNIERVISVSSPIADMISWSMGLPTHVLRSSIDHRLYYFDHTRKLPHLVYIARKGAHAECLKRMLGARNPAFINDFKWVGMDDLNESDYAEQVRQAAVFLNLSLAEGFPTSCMEAMASGTLVAGYSSMGDDAHMHADGPGQNCLLSPIGDYTALAYALEPFLTALRMGQMGEWNRLLSNGLETASGLTSESEVNALVSFWRSICSNQVPSQRI